MKCKICPVCGHLESKGTEYCTQCNTKTIDYDDGVYEPGMEQEEGQQDSGPKGEEDGGKGSHGQPGGSKGKGMPLGKIGIVALLVIVGLIVWNRYRDQEDSDSLSRGEPSSRASESEASGSVPESEASSSVPESGEDASGTAAGDDGSHGGEPAQDSEEYDAPSEQESPTEPPEEEVAIEEGINRYELIVADVTWSQAYYDCLDRGGHLVRITTDEEYQAILQQIANEGRENIIFWLGGARNDDSGYYWIYEDGYFGAELLDEDDKYASYWLENEPSFHDDTAGVDENRICMFRQSSSGRWVWNDVPDDVLSVASFYSGKIGYICEYE